MQNKTPIGYDIQVTLTAATTATPTDMTNQCFLSKNFDFMTGDRYRILTTSDDILNVTTAGSSIYNALTAFFAVSNRPSQIVVAKVFEEDQPAYLTSGGIDFTALENVTNGAFDISIDGEVQKVTGLNLSGATTVAEVAEVLNTAMSAYASVTVYNSQVLIKAKTTGESSAIDFATAPATPAGATDVSGILGLTESEGAQAFVGYTHGTIAEEAQKIADATQNGGAFCYGWTLDADYRDTPEQFAFAQWVAARSFRAVCALTSNNVTSYSPTSTTDIGAKCLAENMANVCVFYDDNPQKFPDVEALAIAQGVDYNEADSTLNMKWQQSNMPAVSFPNISTDLTALKNKRINTITGIVGQNINIIREGMNSSQVWYTDMWVDVCNFIAEIEIAALNVFLRNKKIGYTSDGQTKFISACTEIGNKYVTNGAFADRIISNPEAQNGLGLLPAFTIDIQSLENVTAAQRAAREGTPITIYVNPTNAMNTIRINIYEQ